MVTQRINDKDEHVNELNRRLRELKAAYVGLGTSDDFEELFHIIHGPVVQSRFRGLGLSRRGL